MDHTKPAKHLSRVDLHAMTIRDAVVMILIIAGSVFGLMGAKAPSDTDPMIKQAQIYQDGTCVKILSLSRDGETPLLDGAMVLEINNGRIRMKHSDCKRQYCVHRGWAAHNGESIICVPHKTVIDIKGRDNQTALDAVIY